MFSRAHSQILKGLSTIKSNNFRLFDITIWPLTFLISVLLLTAFLAKDSNLFSFVFIGVLGWRVLYHFSIEITTLYMDEYWDQSIDQLMASPIRLRDFALAGTVLAFLKTIVVTVIFLIFYVLVFGSLTFNFFTTIPALLVLAVFGLELGLIFLGCAYLYGSDSFAANFAIADMLSVLSGAFYPLTLFPPLVQSIALIFPTTQAFNIVKSAYNLGTADYTLTIITLIAWGVIALLFNKWALEKARKEGKIIKLK